MKTQNTPKTAANSQNVRKPRLAFNPNMNSQIPDISYPPESTRHTPGPWRVGDALNAEHNELPIYSDDRWLASVYADDYEIDSQCEADARLIAAAPDLLEAAIETGHDLAEIALWIKCPESKPEAKLASIAQLLKHNQAKRNAAIQKAEAGQ